MANRTTTVVGQVLRAALGEVGMSDAELLRRFAAGNDQPAFAALVRRHGGMVLGVCRRVLPTLQDAEDACQATFLVLARKAKSTRWGPSVANWLFATARKVARNARVIVERRAKREGRAAVPEAVQPVDEMTGRELLAALDEELDRLSPRYREPLVLCYLEGLTRDEAARRLGVPEATLKAQLERGRKRLGAALTVRGCALGVGLLALAATSPAAGASPPRLVSSVLATASGRAPAAVAALAEGVAVNGLGNKTLLLLFALVGVVALAAGLGSASQGQPPDKAMPAGAKDRPKSDRPAAGRVEDLRGDEKDIPFAGRVVGSDGKPVVGAKLVVLMDETSAPAPQPATAADGRFSFRLPRPGEGTRERFMIAAAPRHGVAWFQVTGDPQTDVVLELVPDQPITGRVVDLQGKPVIGARVAVDSIYSGPAGAFDEMLKNWKTSPEAQEQAARKLDHTPWNRGGLAKAFHTNTAADGTFTLAGFGKDRVVTLLVTGPGIADTFAAVATRPGFDPSGAPRTPLRLYPPNFTLPVNPDKPVTGIVRDAVTKAPLPGVRVAGASLVEDVPFGTYLFHAWPTPITTTDRDGRYTLHGLAKARQYVLVADPEEGTAYLHRFIELPDSPGSTPLAGDVDMPHGIILTGRVTDVTSGAGVQSRVFFRPLQKNELLGQFPGYSPPDLPAPWHRGRDMLSDRDGRYKITVMPGEGVVHFQAQGTVAYETARATQQEIDDGIVDKQYGHFRTVGQGGMYNPDYMNAYKVINLAATQRTATLDVTYKRVMSRKVKIVDAEGKPLTGAAALGLWAEGGIRQPPSPAEFTATGLDVGHARWVLFYHAERKLAGTALLDFKSADPVTVKLEPLGSITGRLVQKDGTAAPGLKVTFFMQDEEVKGWGELRKKDVAFVVSDADGRFRLDDVPAGLPVIVHAGKSETGFHSHVKERVQVKPGEVLDLGIVRESR